MDENNIIDTFYSWLSELVDILSLTESEYYWIEKNWYAVYKSECDEESI